MKRLGWIAMTAVGPVTDGLSAILYPSMEDAMDAYSGNPAAPKIVSTYPVVKVDGRLRACAGQAGGDQVSAVDRGRCDCGAVKERHPNGLLSCPACDDAGRFSWVDREWIVRKHEPPRALYDGAAELGEEW